MTLPQAIFAGALFVAAAVFAANVIHPAAAYGGGPYQIMHHSNPQALAGVFRLDTTSGEVSYCFLPGNSNGLELACSKSVK